MTRRTARLLLVAAAFARAAAKGWVGDPNRAFKTSRDPPNDLPPHFPVVDPSAHPAWYRRWLANGGTSRKWAAMDEYERAWAKVEAGAKRGARHKRLTSHGRPHRAAEIEAMGRQFESRKLFVIVTIQRTGSTWLVEELDRHPCIRCSLELFLNTKPGQTDERNPTVFNWTGAGKFAAIEGLANGNIHAHDRVSAVESVDDRYELNRRRCARYDPMEQLRRHRHHKRAVCGFKWMVSQKVDLYWRLWFGRMAREHDIGLVFLKRLNILRVWVSLVDKRRGTSIYEKSKEGKNMNIADGPRLLKYLGYIERDYAIMDDLQRNATRMGVRTLSITYEDLLKDRDGGMKAVADFVLHPKTGAEGLCENRRKFDFSDASKTKSFGGHTGPKTQVVHPRPMSSYVRNWPAVVATLRGTHREKYLTMDGSSIAV